VFRKWPLGDGSHQTEVNNKVYADGRVLSTKWT